MSYFVMICVGDYPSAAIAKGPDLGEPPWYHGRRLRRQYDVPLVYTLDESRPGSLCAMYDDQAYPLMRRDLSDALSSAGVDNLQLFDAEIRDPSTGQIHRDYQAFNIIGVVRAADMNLSATMEHSESTIIDVDFDSLALTNPSELGHLKLFRLAESVNAILVHQSVRSEVEARRISGLEFLDPEDWSG